LAEHQNSSSLSERKIFREATWLFSSYALSKLARVVMMLVVAALLSPGEYGVITLSTVIIVTTIIIVEFGIWQAVVHRAGADRVFLNTAFTANLISGTIITISVIATAPWVASLFREPEMTSMLRVMALALLSHAIFCVPDGLLRKELKFKSRMVPEVFGTVGGVTTTIVLLLLDVGVLSYAVGFVVESVVRCAFTLRKVNWLPSLQASWVSLQEMVSYGKHILGSELSRYFSSNIDYILVGSILGAGPLGFYTLAFNLSNYLVTHVAEVLSYIAFPAFASLQKDLHHARQVYLKMVQLIAALAMPILVTLALLATPLIVVFLGNKWQPAVVPLQIMVAAGIFRAISLPSSDMLRGLGFPKWPLKIDILEGVLMTGILLLVAAQGIETVALSVMIVRSLASWVVVIAGCRVFEIAPIELGQALVPGVTLAASGAAAILALEFFVPHVLSGAPRLIMLGSAAGTATILCLVTVYRELLREAITHVTSRKSDAPPEEVSNHRVYQ
jgi:O-antigen/teichoic acid export membrane protein